MLTLMMQLQQCRLDRLHIKLQKTIDNQDSSLSKKNYRMSNKNRSFYDVIAGWKNCPKFDEYLAKRVKIRIYKITKTNSRCKSQKTSHSNT
jgi:hypothetical protein